jgi:Mg-chelatase subunit ChlD
VSFAVPWWLLLLLLLWLIPAAAKRSLEDPPGSRRTTSIVVRLLLLATVILALARPYARGASDRLTVVFAVDASDSVGAEGRSLVEDFLAEAAQEIGPLDRAAVVVFGDEALVEAAPSPLLARPPWASRPASGGTDAGAALRLASALFEPGSGRRVVLLTDGQENHGSLEQAAAATTAAGIALDLVPIPGRPAQDVRLESLRAPSRAAEGEPIDLRAVLRADRPTRALLRYYQGTQLIAWDEVTLEPNKANLFTLTARPPASGFTTYRARVEVAGDPVPQNNVCEAGVEVRGEPVVLLAAARPQALEPLARMLASRAIKLDLVGLDGLPSTLAELLRYRAVVLSNVAAEDLGETGMELLASYVRDGGGSLVMGGGRRSFGPGGYLGTPLEDVLPIWMEVKDRRYFPSVALVAAIDKSGSMAGLGAAQKIEVAKAGAAAAIDVLEPTDEAGVVGFDQAAQWVVKLQRLDDRKTVLRQLATLRAGGGTDIYPAMYEAEQALKASDRRVKHLILLSDGISPPRDYQGLARRMAGQGITVSTVAVGADADSHTMRVIAKAGGGRTYAARDPGLLPRIFTKEALTVQRSYVVEESFDARVVASHEVLAGIDFAGAPPLHGYVAGFEKGQGELLLASHRNDPVLSVWRVGLGKAVAFTPDLEGRWSSDWTTWGGWGRLWSQVLRWCISGSTSRGLYVTGRVRAGVLEVQADAVGPDGAYLNFAELHGVVSDPGGARQELTLLQTGPGQYEGRFTVGRSGPHLVSVSRTRRGQVVGAGTTTVEVPYAPEFRPSGDGLANLERVAALSGARLSPDPNQVFDHDLTIPGERRSLRPLLLWVLPALLLLDVGVRRVALPQGWWARVARVFRPRSCSDSAATASLARLRSAKHAAAHRRRPSNDAGDCGVPPPEAQRSAPRTPVANAEPPAAGIESRGEGPAFGTTTGHLLEARRRRQKG